jgi:hypothetical protein
MFRRELRKIEVLSIHDEHVYECNSCIWSVRVNPDCHLSEIQAKFDEHRCAQFPLSVRNAKASSYR